MQALLEVILPVFLVVGFGYAAVWRGFFSEAGVEGLMAFAQNFALPCMLFLAISTIDLGQTFELRLLGPFYGGALICFALGMLGARWLFRRPWPDSVAIGFCTLFSNSLLLGVPITERAYGPDALASNWAIVSIHAPVCYAVGLTVMEAVRAGGRGIAGAMRAIADSMLRNALLIGIALGFAVNLSGMPVPGVVVEGLDLMVRAALPAALFGLGGILYRYRPEGDAMTIAYICAVSLLVHPALTWSFAMLVGLDRDGLRSAVVTAAMAPGVNTYIFANLYGVARRVAASSVLIATAASTLSVWLWLEVLP